MVTGIQANAQVAAAGLNSLGRTNRFDNPALRGVLAHRAESGTLHVFASASLGSPSRSSLSNLARQTGSPTVRA